MGSIERGLVIAAVLLLLSVGASKTASRFGVPLLVVFLGIGMLGGSEGPGRIAFHDIGMTQGLAVVALCLILFSGGMDTDYKAVRPVLKSGLLLSTVGVVIATFSVGWFATRFLYFSRIAGLLLGATIASTDVAAVFTVLRSRNVNLKEGLRPLLEFESAVNDPMTVFLSVGLLQIYLKNPGGSLLLLLPMFVKQVALGAVLGVAGALAGIALINRINLDFAGLYPVLSIALVFLIYGVTQALGGSGFLAVYLAGICFGNRGFLYKKSISQFHDGLTWLMQIAMFLAMGLLVLPDELNKVAFSGLLLSAFLLFVARPVSVALCLLPFGFGAREIGLVSWAGLRGAVPIILATYPLIAGIPEARTIFNLVFSSC
jgi:cell volume regulation protein A